jgi:hypothetical protein
MRLLHKSGTSSKASNVDERFLSRVISDLNYSTYDDKKNISERKDSASEVSDHNWLICFRLGHQLQLSTGAAQG